MKLKGYNEKARRAARREEQLDEGQDLRTRVAKSGKLTAKQARKRFNANGPDGWNSPDD